MHSSPTTVRRALAALAFSAALQACATSAAPRDSSVPAPPPRPADLAAVSEAPAFDERDGALARVSLLVEHGAAARWTDAVRAALGEDSRVRLGLDPGRGSGSEALPAAELDFEVPPPLLPGLTERLAGAARAAFAPGLRTIAAGQGPGGEWDRSALLGCTPPDVGATPRWHASVLAPVTEFERVRSAFAPVRAALESFEHRVARAAPRSAANATEVALFLARASRPSEVRWVPPAQRSAAASPEQRALECVVVAALARELEGWTFVPASVDVAGRLEPACLVAVADFAAAKARVAALRAALAVPRIPEDAPAVLRERTAYARAQLSRDEFRLRALHGSELPRFRADLAALERLALAGARAPDLARGGFWGVVGPPEAWSAELAGLGTPSVHRPTARTDAALEDDLARMWSALGGSERWRGLATLRLLGVLTPEDGSRQGIEQWVDLAGSRFALSQAVGSKETLIASTDAEAWIVDGARGIDLEPDQARKFRDRAERTWFSVLRRLAQEGREGLSLEFDDSDGRRIVVLEGPRALCWIELGDDGLPRALGYRLGEADEASVYEFSDWRVDGALPYPARTLQRDRNATFEIQHLEANGTLDASLWKRG